MKGCVVKLLIHGQEYGNSYGCTYSIRFSKVVLVVTLKWEDDFFSFNQEEINEELDKAKEISKELRLAIYQYIEKTNYLFYLSYKELH